MARSLRIGVFVAVGLLAVFSLISFITYLPAIEAARRAGFSDDVIELGLQKSFEARLIFWGSQFAQIALLCWLGLTADGRRLAEYWLKSCGSRMWLAALLMVLTIGIARELLLLPFNLLGYFHGRRWEMLAEQYTLLAWAYDYILSTFLDGLLLVPSIVIFFWLLKRFPKTWWAIAPAGGAVFAIAYATLAPLLLDPLMNRFVPLEETKWKDLKPQLMALVDKAEIPVKEILVMDASKRSSHTNAYFSGFGSTRRIVLYDTLLKQLSPKEVEAVLAHEIGHWESDHIVYGILLGVLGMFVACWTLDGILITSLRQEPWLAEAKFDPRLVGWIILLLILGQWIVRPIENQISRIFESQADLRSLELIEDPQLAIDCEKRMAISNKSNVAPSPWNTWMFSTHPSSVQRIERATSWKPGL